MDADPNAAAANPEDETPPSRRRGIGLCLSGGGFRATLFHLGAIQRLFELGIATRPDFDTITSVSGGSITAAQWAVAQARLLRPMPSEGGLAMTGLAMTGQEYQSPSATPSLRGASPSAGDEAIPPLDFTRDIARPLQALTARDIRTAAMAKKYLLPWNWFRGAFVIDASAKPALGA